MTVKSGCLGLLLSLIAFTSYADDQLVSIKPAGSQKSIAGPAENFTGSVRVDPLFSDDNAINASSSYVTFESGSRTNWHVHPAGQRLIVISGVGLTQQEGQPVQIIRPGDVVSSPPGVKHWHGASADTAMTHLTVTGMAKGKSVKWMEKVTDEPYRND